MRSYIIAIFTLLTFSLAGWMNGLVSDAEQGIATIELKQASEGERERNILKEFGSDMLRTATEAMCEAQHTISHHSQNNARQRNSHSTKSNLHTTPSQHIGHVTNIFDYTLKTSSQRVEYYLHTLCRLRI